MYTKNIERASDRWQEIENGTFGFRGINFNVTPLVTIEYSKTHLTNNFI